MSTKSYRRWCVVLVLVAIYAVYRLTLHWMVDAKLREIRQLGYPVTLAELNQWYPTPPPGKNAADIYSQAISHLNSWTNNLVEVLRPPRRGRGRGYAPDADMSSTAQLVRVSIPKRELLPFVGEAKLPARTEALSNDVRQFGMEYLTDNTETLMLLHRISAIQQSRYPIDLTNGSETLLPHLSHLRDMARLLSLEAIIAAEKGDGQRATVAIGAGFGWAKSLEQEPLLISQLVRIICLGITVSSLERTLNRVILTDSELEQLRMLVHQMESSQPTSRSLEGVRCIGTSIFQHPQRYYFPPSSKLTTIMFAAYKLTGLMDLDHLNYLRFMECFREVCQSPLHARLKDIQSLESSIENQPRYHGLSRMLLPALPSVVKKDARSIAHLTAAESALVIERYRLAKGKLPGKLDDCEPTFCAAVPTDPFDGQPLRYKKLAKGYVVYSVGEDGKDNGGDKKKDITFAVEL